MNDLDLARALRERAADVHPPAGLAAGARQHARQIRLRRRITAGTVVAVAVAAGVPAALSVGDTTRGAPQPAETPSPTPTRVVDSPATISLLDLPAGPQPAVGWAQGTTFHAAGGGLVEIPQDLGSLVGYGDGVAGYDYGTGEVWFAAGGRIPGFGPVVSADGDRIAWSYYETTASGLVVAPADEPGGGDNTLTTEVPAEVEVHPVGLLGDDLVSNVVDQGVSVRVRRDTFDGPPTSPWDVGAVSAVSESAQLVAGRTALRIDGSCWAVLPADGGPVRWETCRHSLDRFSPDGRSVLAGPAYRSGLGDTTMAILDSATGAMVRSFDVPRDAFILDTAFEDDTHVLAVVWQQNRSAVVRCGLDGACERATDLVPGSDTEVPLRLAAGP